MAAEMIIALDLEGTLISNAVSQFPRPGLRMFLEFCNQSFDRVYLYTAVPDGLCIPIVETMVREGTAPDWMLSAPIVQWNGPCKDLANIPAARPTDCLLVDDNRDYVLDSQLSQWIPVEKYSSPYPKTDRELARVQQVIERRLAGLSGAG